MVGNETDWQHTTLQLSAAYLAFLCWSTQVVHISQWCIFIFTSSTVIAIPANLIIIVIIIHIRDIAGPSARVYYIALALAQLLSIAVFHTLDLLQSAISYLFLHQMNCLYACVFCIT
jgi:hypothetical protein